MRFVIGYVATLLTFCIVDFVWLGPACKFFAWRRRIDRRLHGHARDRQLRVTGFQGRYGIPEAPPRTTVGRAN